MNLSLITDLIETPRLRLRRFVPEDAEAIFYGWATDEQCMRFLTQSPHKDMEDTRMRLSFWIDEYQDGALNWAIERREDGLLIGNIKTERVEKQNLYCEIGYCLTSAYHNQGYATEALCAVLDYLLHTCGFQKVAACHTANNPASGRVMQKAGMHYEATLKNRIYDKTEHSFDDLLIYST